jgi:hypothetical protein
MSGRSEWWMRASQGRRIQHPTADANEAQSPLRVVFLQRPSFADPSVRAALADTQSQCTCGARVVGRPVLHRN